MYENLGTKLKIERIKANLSQKEIAERIHTTSTRISSYERGTSLPPVNILARLAATYHVSVDYLLDIDKKRVVEVDGLTDSQIAAVEHVVDEFRKR